MVAKKKSKRRPKRPITRLPGDPFGLEGRDLRRSSISKREIPSWFKEMRGELKRRWDIVEDFKRAGCLTKQLVKELGREISPREAKRWFPNAKQDHRWRMRLLSPRTSEGSLYLAYSHLVLENEFFAPNHERIQEIRKLVLFVLDLDEVPDPFFAPCIRSPAIMPGDAVRRPKVRRKEDGLLLILPMEGLRIPRRFRKVRASQEISAFLEDRSDRYWNDVLRYLKWITDKSLEGWKDGVSEEILKEFYGESSMDWIKTFRIPQLRLSNETAVRDSILSERELARAGRLRTQWYPQVKKAVALKKKGRKPSGFPAAFMDLFKRVYPMETQAQRVTLQMVIIHLDLPVATDTLRRRLKDRRHLNRK